MPWPGLRALGHRDYRLFWAGQIVSLVGTWMQSVGQSWLVLELTNSPFRLGLLGTLQFGPMLLLAFLAGAIADRVRKRRLIMATQSALMCQAFALSALAWTGHVQYWHVAVLAVLYGVATALDMPTRQSFMTDLVGKGDLPGAIALNSAVFNSARVVGPAMAGVLVARYGVAPAFLVNGLSFLAVLAALAAIRTEGDPRPRAGATLFEDIAEGARYAAGTPLVALILGYAGAVSLFVLNFNTLVALQAREVLGQGARGFGLLMAALGAGAVTGAVVLARLASGRPPMWLLIGGGIVVSGATAGLSLVRHFDLAAVVLFAMGCSQILFTASCNTTLQIITPDRLRGRMMSLYAWVFVGSTPIGALFIGSVAERLGVSAACAIGGGAGLVLVLLLTAWWMRRGARASSTASRGGRGLGS